MSDGTWLDNQLNPAEFESLLAKFGSAEHLPDLPQSALQLCDAIDKGDVNANELERLILADPAITAGVLKAANSAMFGGKSNQASTVKGSILLLGQKTIRSIAVSVWVQSLVYQSKGSQKFSPTKFAEHSMFVGFLSKFLLSAASRTRGVRSVWSPDELFAAGVLHDLGIGLLASIDPKLFNRVYEIGETYGWSTHQAFTQITGHCLDELSVAAATAWRLPDLFITCLNGFSNPLEAEAEVDALCCLYYADYLADRFGNSLVEWKVEVTIDDAIVSRIGIDNDDIPEILQIVSASTKQFVVAA